MVFDLYFKILKYYHFSVFNGNEYERLYYFIINVILNSETIKKGMRIMKKVLKKMTVLSLALCLTSMAYNPIHAANDTNDIDYKPVFDASMQYAEKFEEIGISPEVLQEIMALEPKKESTTQNLSNNNDKVTNYFQKKTLI